MNVDTDWTKISKCRLAGVMIDIITQILGLRVKFWTQKCILLQKMDTKNAFQQMGMAPDRTATFVYRLEDVIFVDRRLQFGWRGNPGWWRVVAGGGERNIGSPSGDDMGIGG